MTNRDLVIGRLTWVRAMIAEVDIVSLIVLIDVYDINDTPYIYVINPTSDKIRKASIPLSSIGLDENRIHTKFEVSCFKTREEALNNETQH